jgi:hypothetical protein
VNSCYKKPGFFFQPCSLCQIVRKQLCRTLYIGIILICHLYLRASGNRPLDSFLEGRPSTGSRMLCTKENKKVTFSLQTWPLIHTLILILPVRWQKSELNPLPFHISLEKGDTTLLSTSSRGAFSQEILWNPKKSQEIPRNQVTTRKSSHDFW